MKWKEVSTREFQLDTAIGRFKIYYDDRKARFVIETPILYGALAPLETFTSLQMAKTVVNDIIRKTAAALLKDLGEV